MPKQTKKRLVPITRLHISMVREINEAPAVIRSPADTVQHLRHLRRADREIFTVVVLNARNGVLGVNDVSTGVIDATLVSPSNIFKPAILMNGAAVILAHVHPSGDCTASAEDVRITRQLIDAGRLLEVKVCDHLIIGGDRHLSMREEGLAQFS